MGMLQLYKVFFGANKERGGRCRIWNSNRGTERAFLTLAASSFSCLGAWPLASGEALWPQRHTQIFMALLHGLCVNPCKITWVSFRWFVFSAPLKTWQPSLSLKAISMHISFISQWLVILSESVIFNIYLSLNLLPCKYYKNEHGDMVNLWWFIFHNSST